MKQAKSKSLSSFIFIPLLLLILIKPFFSDLAYPAFEFWYEILIFFLGIIGIFSIRPHRQTRSNNIVQAGAILILLSAYIISTTVSNNPGKSFKEILRLISYISVFYLVSGTSQEQKKTIIKVIVTCASVISVYSIYQYFWGYQHTLHYLKQTNSDFLSVFPVVKDILILKRAIGTFPSPNIFGSYLIMIFFVSLTLLKDSSIKKWAFPSLLIFTALVLTKSTGAWISFIAGFAVLFIFSYHSLKKQKSMFIIISILMLLALSFVILGRCHRLLDLKDPHNSIMERLNYWRTAITIIKDHPFTGVGPGNFHEAFSKHNLITNRGTYYAHNIFLHIWSETGILGILGILFLIGSFLKKIRVDSEKRFIFLGMLAFLLHNLIDNTFFISQVGIFWWILLGFL